MSEFMYVKTYEKQVYTLESACVEFILTYLGEHIHSSFIEYLDCVSYLKYHRQLKLEEGKDLIIILSVIDFEELELEF